jgi:hypothetical protein
MPSCLREALAGRVSEQWEPQNLMTQRRCVHVKYPMHECRGFYAGCPALASSKPVFVALSMESGFALSMSTSGTQTVGTFMLLP